MATRDNRLRIKKVFFVLSLLLFLAVNIPFFAMFLDDFGRDQYCHFIGENDPYDFEYPPGRKCDFNFSALEEPIGVFLLAHTLFQTPLWIVYGGVRFLAKLFEK